MGILDSIKVLPEEKKKKPQKKVKIIPTVQHYPVMDKADLVVYTDGSVYTLSQKYCLSSKNIASEKDIGRTFGAYAFAIWNNKTGDLIYEEVNAGENWGRQGPELLAMYFALKYLVNNYIGHNIVVFSDSNYVLKSLGATWLDNGWIHTWEDNNWLNYDGNPVKYKDHFKKCGQFLKQFKHCDKPYSPSVLNMYWVKGHHEDARNHYVDELAGKARKEYQQRALCTK